MKEKEAIAVGFFSDLESSWAATKIFREVVVDLADVVVVVVVVNLKSSWAVVDVVVGVVAVILVGGTNSSEWSSLMCSLSLLTSLLFTG